VRKDVQLRIKGRAGRKGARFRDEKHPERGGGGRASRSASLKGKERSILLVIILKKPSGILMRRILGKEEGGGERSLGYVRQIHLFGSDIFRRSNSWEEESGENPVMETLNERGRIKLGLATKELQNMVSRCLEKW